MDIIIDNLYLFIPLIIIDLLLKITALAHIFKHHIFKIGNRAMWIIIVILFNIFGPVLYFAFGRGDN
ncbi:PLDc N-terminal domain-containing protein [Clostridiaceae bacterium M8S5]|nr:PLDc N-terminal domain-containing protein [Clostridiaceae bacterium M8S5]